MILNTIVVTINILMTVSIVMMSIRLRKSSAKLMKAADRLKRMENLYACMTNELQNIVDSIMLSDRDGANLFYEKMLKLHEQFMLIGKDDI
ncbi:MAG: hypothetical protein M0R50_11765 [Candidatus Cloacimonetes bacterium]|jgi:hypothetical protein|nr:hypothetical protein [Candidatus Cloacimonadota bacterium]